MKLTFGLCLASYLLLSVSAMEYGDEGDKMDKMDKKVMMDKKDKMKKTPLPESRCVKQGQFLKNPNGDQCSYMICVYGGESYDSAEHKPLMYTRPMPCAPGTYVPINYKDTRPARNPCVGMEPEACPAPEKPKMEPEESEEEVVEEVEEEPEEEEYVPAPVVNSPYVRNNAPVKPLINSRRAEMDRLYQEMTRMMEQMMAIRRRLETYQGPGSYSPEPRTFQASPGLFPPEPTTSNADMPSEEDVVEEEEETSYPGKVKLQQAGYALAGGNGIVTSLPKEEVNHIWHGVQKVLKTDGGKSGQSQGYPKVTSYNQQEERPSTGPQQAYRSIFPKSTPRNGRNPQVVYLLPVRMPVKRNQ